MKEIEKCDIQSSGNSCMDCQVRQFSLLEGLSEKELFLLNDHRGTRQYKAGETIFKEGDEPNGLLCLHSGKVKITKAGLLENDAIIALKKPVEFLGLEALIQEKKYTTSAIALEAVRICFLKKENFLKVLKENPALALKVMTLLAKRNTTANERMLILTQKHLRGRLADALLLLHNEYGFLADNHTLDIQLKRAELAALANMTPANAIRILSVFTKEGLIETCKRQIIIKDLSGLRKTSQLG